LTRWMGRMKISAQLGQSFFRRQVCRLKLTEQDIAVNRHDSSPANLPAGAYAGARVRGKAAPAFVRHRPKGGISGSVRSLGRGRAAAGRVLGTASGRSLVSVAGA